MREPRTRALLWALAASVCLHALLLALLIALPRGREREVARAPSVVPVELARAPVAETESVTEAETVTQTEALTRPATATGAGKATETDTGAAAGTVTATDTAPAAAAGADAVAGAAATAEAATVPGGGAGGRAGVSLFDPRAIERALGLPGPGAGLGRGRGSGGGAGEGLSAGEAAEAVRVARRIGEFAREATDGGRVEAGIVDPYFAGLRGGMQRAFEPGGAASDGTDSPVSRAEDAVRGWRQSAEQYARSGNPYKESAAPFDPHGAAQRPAAAPSITPPASSAYSRQIDWLQGNLGTVDVVALIELVQPTYGGAQARVLQSSGRSDYDARAVDAVKEAAAELGRPPPPPDDADDPFVRTRSLWEFRTGFASASPIQLAADPATGAPMAVFGYPAFFDETGTTDSEHGFQRRIIRVRLVALHQERASQVYGE
jgi:hypothetical protein